MLSRISLLAVGLVVSFAAHAAEVDQKSKERAVDAGVGSAQEALAAIEDSGYREVLQGALNSMVSTAVTTLREQGFESAAAHYEGEWAARFSSSLTSFSVENLGDHAPMSQWLSNFYSDLTGKLGVELCHSLRLDDINIFNYGIPVTLHPTGCHGDSWDRAEYALHFVPVTGAASYWITNNACNAVLPGLLSLLCGQAAEVVRSVVESDVAPALSDYVYRSAHGEKVSRPDAHLQ